MILAFRIPELTERMYAATVRAAATHEEDAPVREMIEYLQSRGYHVAPPRRAA